MCRIFYKAERVIIAVTRENLTSGVHYPSCLNDLVVSLRDLEHEVLMEGSLAGKHVSLPILAVLMVAGNGVLIYVTMRDKTLRTVTNFLVVSLAVADLLMGALVLPLLVLAEEGLLGPSPKVCLMVMCFAISEVLVSCLVLFAIAVERYIAIRCPLRHHALMCTRNALLIIAACWCYSLCVGALPLVGWNALTHNMTNSSTFQCRYHVVIPGSYAAFMYPGHFVPLWIMLITLYSLIYVRTRRHGSRESVRRLSLTLQPHRPQRRARENWRALRILTVIVGYFLLSWLGMVIWYAFLYRGFTIENAQGATSLLPNWFYTIAVTLAFGNSALNPFIYGLGNRSVRRSFLLTFFHWRRRERGWGDGSTSMKCRPLQYPLVGTPAKLLQQAVCNGTPKHVIVKDTDTVLNHDSL